MNTKALVDKKLRHFKPLLGLAGWEHIINVHDAQPESEKTEPFDEQSALDVEAQPQYLKFVVNVYPKFAVRIKQHDYNADLYIVHELVHVLLADYDKLLDKFLGENDQYFHEQISERTTETIARAILRSIYIARGKPLPNWA